MEMRNAGLIFGTMRAGEEAGAEEGTGAEIGAGGKKSSSGGGGGGMSSIAASGGEAGRWTGDRPDMGDVGSELSISIGSGEALVGSSVSAIGITDFCC